MWSRKREAGTSKSIKGGGVKRLRSRSREVGSTESVEGGEVKVGEGKEVGSTKGIFSIELRRQRIGVQGSSIKGLMSEDEREERACNKI